MGREPRTRRQNGSQQPLLDEESMMLLHKIISLAENEVVDLYEESLPMREEPYGMVVDGFKTIEEFARENHYADPEQDFEDVWP